MLSAYLSLMLCLSFLVYLCASPLVISLLLVMGALLCGGITWSLGAKWLSISIILVFIGGMMVAFIYVSSLAFNQKFVFPIPTALVIMAVSLVMFMSYMMFTWMVNFSPTPSLALYSYPTAPAILGLVLYLLALMFMVVKLTECFKGSLVQKF